MDAARRAASRRLLSGAILLTFVLVFVALVVVLRQPTSPSWDDIVQSKGFLPGESHLPQPHLTYREAPDDERFVNKLDTDVKAYLLSTNNSAEGEEAILPLAQRPLCSPALLRQYYRTKGYFPSAGAWTPGDTYNPNICKFGFHLPMPSALKQCFARQKIKSIVVFGASQGKAYSAPLLKFISQAFPKCRSVKSEKQVDRLPQVSYYTAGRPDIVGRLLASKRHCSGCTSQKFICGGRGGVSVEYFGMDDLLDSTLRLVMPSRPNSIETFQEFIFHKYLAPNPPDLIIISPTANHAKFKSSPAKFALDVTYFKNLIRLYFPKTTRVLWLTGMSEFTNVKATKSISRLNHVLFEVNKNDYLDPDSGVLGFFDLVPMSLTCPKSWWGHQTVHLAPSWYKEIMREALAYFCA